MIRRAFFLALLLFLAMPFARGEVVVVVDAGSQVTHLVQDDVINIFLGRYRQYPNGEPAYPVDQPKSSELRAAFYQGLTGKSLSEINAYWARLYFSGAMRPPVQAATSNEVLAYVLTTRGGIGYLERSQVDSRVRVLLALPP